MTLSRWWPVAGQKPGREDLGDEGGLAECMEGLATTCRAADRPEEAVTLLGAAHAVRETCGVAASVPERDETSAQIEELRASLGPKAFAKAWEAGIKMDADEAIDRCLGLASAPIRAS